MWSGVLMSWTGSEPRSCWRLTLDRVEGLAAGLVVIATAEPLVVDPSR